MTDTNEIGYLFFSGPDMDPAAIRSAYPGARFVARSRLITADVALPPAYAGLRGTDIWGILVAIPSQPAGSVVDVMTDDGRRFQAHLGSEGVLGGAPEAVLAAARYWELPPPYIGRLRSLVQALGIPADEEEPRDGN